jgi:hypothetical protein
MSTRPACSLNRSRPNKAPSCEALPLVRSTLRRWRRLMLRRYCLNTEDRKRVVADELESLA